MYCSHPRRHTQSIDCGSYIAVMIYCTVCGAFITQVNQYKDRDTSYDKEYRNPHNDRED